jgi:hypothetical protein
LKKAAFLKRFTLNEFGGLKNFIDKLMFELIVNPSIFGLDYPAEIL